MENFLMSNDVELASNRFDNGISNTANGLSWLTTPPGISCSPCWSAASSGSSNIFIRNSEEAFCEQLGTPVVNASASERSTANTGMSIGLFKYSFFTLIQSVFLANYSDEYVSKTKRFCPFQWHCVIAS